MLIWEYVGPKGQRAFTDAVLEVRQRSRLDAKLDLMETGGFEVANQVLAPVRGFGLLRKLKIEVQKVALRPLFCFGPFAGQSNLTFLLCAREVNWDWEPANSREIANQRREEILSGDSPRYLLRGEMDEPDPNQTN